MGSFNGFIYSISYANHGHIYQLSSFALTLHLVTRNNSYSVSYTCITWPNANYGHIYQLSSFVLTFHLVTRSSYSVSYMYYLA
jgi:hypothetical protein